MDIETQLTAGFRRLADKGFFNSPSHGLSIRNPGTGDMLLATCFENKLDMFEAASCAGPCRTESSVAKLHAGIYLQRPDVGAISISSPKGVQLLARSGDILPPLFDEQVRHIGASNLARLDEISETHLRKAFRKGNNAALLGDSLVCLGMTSERAIFNTELFEKCALAYVISRASGKHPGVIPIWVRLIANHRLMRDERRAAACFRDGRFPDGISAY